MFGQLDGAIDCLQHVRLDQLALAKDADAGAVAVEEGAVFGELGQLYPRHVHQGIDFVF